jgi:Fe-S cluster assembly ATP-binding protein
MELLSMDKSYADRDLNVGFSGGEKKKAEILQMLMMKPDLAILDETDSGLDVDALRIVANGFNKLRTSETSGIIITHYQRLLEYIVPDVVHVLIDGKIVKTGGADLARKIEDEGFEFITNSKL